MLKEIFGLEVVDQWGMLRSQELYHLYCVFKSRRLKTDTKC